MSTPTPTHPDVLILGGGIIGMLTAVELARKGVQVTVLERGRPMRESSWAGAGILSPIYPWKYPDALSILVNRSLALYPQMMERLQALSGVDPEHRKTGLIMPVFRSSEWFSMDGVDPWRRRFGWQVERLTGAEARQVEPCLAKKVVGALYFPEVGQVRNPRLARAVEATARVLGVDIRYGEEVIDLSVKGGRVSTVTTNNGKLRAGKVLVAAGSWSGELLKKAGYTLPIQPVKGQILLLKTAPGTLTRIVKHADAYLVPRADGRILVGATMEMAGFDRRTTLSALHTLSGALLTMAPCLADAQVEQHWMGFRPGTPDGLPYLGQVPGYDNLYVAAGHYRNGVVLAPVTAEAMSCLLTDDALTVPLGAFAVQREVQASAEVGLPTP